jgi:hypothetical protein
MNLMLKQMQQKPVHSLMLNARATMHLDDTLQTMGVKAFDDGDQAPIHVCLRLSESIQGRAWLWVCPSCWPERAALHCVHVEKVDDQDMVQGSSHAREEAGAWGDEFRL